MLEHCACLHLEHIGGVRAGEAVVEFGFDGVADAGACLGGSLPVEGKDAAKLRQPLATFFLRGDIGGEVGAGSREEIEDDELLAGMTNRGNSVKFTGEMRASCPARSAPGSNSQWSSSHTASTVGP